MPIRINLLAEQQAAEEARRRDPVKRALWAACGLMALVLVWAASKQIQLVRARGQLNTKETQWKQMEPAFLQASNRVKEAGMIERRLDELQLYVTNRFLWTDALNALQHATDDQVRIVSLAGTANLHEDKQLVVSSNLYIMRPARRWWSFWTVEPPKTNMHDWARQTLGTLTNRPELLRFQPQLKTSLNVVTNRIQIIAQMEIVKPQTVAETIALTLRARDYSQPHGSRMDKFFSGITNQPYFLQALGNKRGSIQPESVQARDDRTDLIRPNDLFIPFTVEWVLSETIRSNE